MLGGVRIPYEQGLQGHSDADVVLHALCDALLGAAGLRDIGTYFPDTSKKFKNISSGKLLEKVRLMIAAKGYEIVNVDSTVVLQRPRIAPHVSTMAKRIAKALKITPGQVSIKATTNEGMGFIGRGAACAVYAIATIRTSEKE